MPTARNYDIVASCGDGRVSSEIGGGGTFGTALAGVINYVRYSLN